MAGLKEKLEVVSNDYICPMIINYERWDSVSQYVYSSLTEDEVLNLKVKNGTSNYFENGLKIYEESLQNSFKKCVRNVIEISFKKNSQRYKDLLATNYNTLIYKTENKFGKYYVEALMEYRNSNIVKPKQTLKQSFNQEEFHKDIILNIYLEDLIKNKYPNIPNPKQAATFNKSKLSNYDKRTLENRVYKIYKNKKFSKKLMGEIDLMLKNINIEEKEDEEEVYNPEIPIIDKNEIFTFSDNTEERNSWLSPAYYTGMLNIEGFYFPTMIHYIYFCSFSSLKSMSENYAHSLIMVDQNLDPKIPQNYKSIRNLTNLYSNYTFFRMIKIVESNFKKAFDTKLQIPEILYIVSTIPKDTEIKYVSEDYILGTGEKNKEGEYNGKNYTGKTYMNFIQNFKAPDNLEKIYSKNVMNYSDNLTEWMNKRRDDIIVMTQLVKSILKSVGINMTVNYYVINFITNWLYPHCFDMKNNFIEGDIPKEIKKNIQRDFKNENIDIDYSGVVSIWMYTITLGNFMIKNFKNKDTLNTFVNMMPNFKLKQKKNIEENFWNALTEISSKLKAWLNVNFKKDFEVSESQLKDIINFIIYPVIDEKEFKNASENNWKIYKNKIKTFLGRNASKKDIKKCAKIYAKTIDFISKNETNKILNRISFFSREQRLVPKRKTQPEFKLEEVEKYIRKYRTKDQDEKETKDDEEEKQESFAKKKYKREENYLDEEGDGEEIYLDEEEEGGEEEIDYGENKGDEYDEEDLARAEEMLYE